MAYDLTMTSATYNTSTKKYGTASLNGGYGSRATLLTGTPFTVQAWVKLGSPPSGLGVIAGQHLAFWLGVNTSGYIQAQYGATIGGTTAVDLNTTVQVCDGSWHHVRFELSSSGCKIFVDGTQAATDSTSPTTAGVAYTDVFEVRTYFRATFNDTFNYTGEIDDLAVFTLVNGSNFTPAQVGTTDTGLLALYAFDSNGNDTAVPPSGGPAITVQPSSQTVSIGGSVTFSVSATTSGGTLTYQWKKGGSNISGATSSSYTISPLALSDAGNFTVAVTDNNGTTTSSTAVLTVSSTSIAPDNAAFVYSPYNWDVTNTRAKSINSGAYFRIGFSGGVCILNFDTSNVGSPIQRVWTRIDGQGPWVDSQMASTISLTMPTATANWPYHLLELVIKTSSQFVNRWNSPQNTAVVFNGLTLAGSATVSAPTKQSKNVIFYGDSITEGDHTTNLSGSPELDRYDSMLGWAWALGVQLDSEFGIVGFGSQGFSTNGGGNVPIVGTTYNLLWSGQSRVFTPTPNLIVVNMGHNDNTTNTVTAATGFLNGLISACSGVPIVVLRPFSGRQAANLQSAIAACNAPSQCHYIDTTGFFNTANSEDSVHPNGYENLTNITPQLLAVIRPYLYPTAGARAFSF